MRDDSKPDLVERVLATLGEAAVPGPSPFLFFTVGLPGTGKTTFSRRLAAETGALVLESDRIRALLFPRPRFTAAENGLVFGTIHAAAEALLRRGVAVIVDATCLSERERRPLYRMAGAVGVRLVISSFHAPLPLVEERLRRRGTRVGYGDYSQAGIEVYHQMADRLQAVSRPHFLVDSSDAASMNETLAAVVGACRPARVARVTGAVPEEEHEE